MDERERRMTQNEALFREVNERITDLAEQQGSDDHVYEYMCECANADCTFHVPLKQAEYEAVRRDPKRFFVLPGHFTPEVESLSEENESYWVVTKTGSAGEYVEALDPRSR
jgi:hypothetical protein